MVEFYFYLDKGQAKGPLEKKEVLKAFEKGELGALDLIFKEGAEKWVPAFEVSEFKELFKDAPKRSFLETPRREWIVLQKKKPDEGKGFRQTGPYTEAEVKNKIQGGQLSYQDYAWKNGITEWTKIRDLEVFAKSSATAKIPALHPDEHLDIKKVTQDKKVSQDAVFSPKMPAMPPPEAEAQDLTRPWESNVEIKITEEKQDTARVEIKKSKATSVGFGDKASEKANEELSETTSKTSKFKHQLKDEAISIIITQTTPQKWLSRLLMVGLGIGFLALVLLMSTSPRDYKLPENIKQKYPQLAEWFSASEPELAGVEKLEVLPPTPPNAPEVKPTAKVAEPAPAPVAAAPVEVKPPPVIEPNPPTRLAALVINGDTLEIQTDGTSHFPIRARLFGQAGKVFGESGVYREAQMIWGADNIPRWSLKPLGLVKGDYMLMLTQDKLTKYQNIRLEDLSLKSLKTLNEAKKWQAIGFNGERRDLAFMAQEFFELSQTLEKSYARHQRSLPQWNKFYKAWTQQRKKLESAKLQGLNLRNKTLPWHWFRMREFSGKLNEKALSYDRSIKSKTEIDESVREIDPTKNFAELKKEILALKIY